MYLRFFFLSFLIHGFIFQTQASTITILHHVNTEVQLKDAVYPHILDIDPKFRYSESTIFEVDRSENQLYLVATNLDEYYLWMDDSTSEIVIDLRYPPPTFTGLIPIKQWNSQELNAKNSALLTLHKIDNYYSMAIDSLRNLAHSEARYRADTVFNTLTWDNRSAKSLFNFAMETFEMQVEKELITSLPAYVDYWHFMYKLYYQYFHVNSFKGLSKAEVKSEIEKNFNSPESELLVFHHFFRSGIPLAELKENFEFLKTSFNDREATLAESLIQKQAVNDLSKNQSIDFLFGIDVDNALKGFFARDTSKRKNVLVFWSTWNSNISTEFNLLADLKKDFKEEYNFIHICIDAYETPEKTKSFIYKNRVEGFHLLPEQSNAFRQSSYKKELKIKDFPFYVLTNSKGEVIETESIPLEISNRLRNKLKYFSTKK
ncbi:TlpA family protein disulfide reductase [Marivirga sp.]|uniref:TlpA family protein disulfide reductase n=1 Tax=Marivirga sp. TaxID=2018662 RepID=UPI002D7F0120|nr:thioredoxin-like domain-containing protein [Marivirga sp.]HET8859501.1 thioredoxin-like domain-containing protein [Marivirga sp.]